MKKLINRPEDVVREELAGIALAHSGRLVVHTDPHWIARADAPVQGKVGLVSGGGSGHEPLHGGFVGPGHARRGLPRRGVHLADARPDAGGDAGGRRRRRRAAHRQELHRRRDELRDGRRAGARRGPHRGAGRDRRRRGRAGQPVHGRPPRRRRDGARGEDRGRRGRGGPAASPRWPTSPHASTSAAAAWAWRSPRAPCPRRASRPSTSADDEIEVGIGIHGEPGRERRPLAPAREIVEMLATPILEDLPFASGDRRARLRQRHGRHAADGALRRVRRGAPAPATSAGIAIARNLVGTVHHRLDMAGCSITLLQARRRADAPVGRARRHARPAVGRVSAAGDAEGAGAAAGCRRPVVDAAAATAWLLAFAAEVAAPARRAHRARRGHRRRRPRRQHGPRHAAAVVGDAGRSGPRAGAERRSGRCSRRSA